MPVDPRWEKIEALFDEALEQPRRERRAWLARVCPQDDPIRREVEVMIAAHERAEGFLDRPAGLPLSELPIEVLQPDLPAALDLRTVGPYRLLAEIGRGGMGIVYQAHDPRLDRHVALKFLPSRSCGPNAAQRFLSEAKAASALDHPNICTIYDIGETEDGHLYIAMAYYQGETLAERLANGPLAVDEATDLALQAARGLERAHQKGIIHRDVKPANLMLTDRLKILDFGVAKLEGSTLTRPGLTPGTLAYMSPEQLEGSTLDVRTDLWSLGVVLYEMLTGERPFDGRNPRDVIRAICEDQPRPLRALRPEVPRNLERLVHRALCKQPEDRHESAADMAGQLSELRRESEASPTRPTISPAGEPSRRLDPELDAEFQTIRFCHTADGRAMAYAVHGNGPPIIFPAWWISHLEHDAENPFIRSFFGALGEHFTVVRYDRPGVGLSDRRRDAFTLEAEVAHLEALVDELAFDSFTLFGISCGGPVSIRYALRHRSKVDRLILYASYACGEALASREVREALISMVRAHWGLGSKTLSQLFDPDLAPRDIRQLEIDQRRAASPEMAARLLELTYRMDVRDAVEHLDVPTLVLHRQDDKTIPVECGRGLATDIPGAKWVPLNGRAHVPWHG